MLLIGLLFLIFLIVDVALKAFTYGGYVFGAILVIGGLYFFHKKKYHWLVYFVALLAAGLINNVLPLIM